MVVETHYYFCVAVIERYGGDFDEDFVWSWGWEGSGGLFEVSDAVLGCYPGFDGGGEGHFEEGCGAAVEE